MNIGKLCQRSAVTVRRSDELTTAAQIMREKHIGYLVVVEPDLAQGGMRPVGVLTDRDIVIAVVAGEADAKPLIEVPAVARKSLEVPLADYEADLLLKVAKK